MSERLQKMLARAGYGSRRQLEQVIEAGRLRINEKIATLGDKAGARDQIRMDGKLLNLEERLDISCRVLAYKKHVDQVVTRKDPEGRPTIFKNLPKLRAGRWLAVGRLDVNTSGLLLVTTDGELKRRLEHPSYEVVRSYAVRVHGTVKEEMLERMLAGVELDDGPARFDSIRVGNDTQSTNRWFEVTVRQGRSRVVRRLWDSQGLTVSRLMRTGFGTVGLSGGVKAGGWKELDRKQIRELAGVVDLKR